MKAHQEMVSNIRRGDTIVTQGGLIGRVTRVKDDGVEIEVEIADKRARLKELERERDFATRRKAELDAQLAEREAELDEE